MGPALSIHELRTNYTTSTYLSHAHSTEAEIETPGLRTHSCRPTAAYYAAWLGIPEATIKVNLTSTLCIYMHI